MLHALSYFPTITDPSRVACFIVAHRFNDTINQLGLIELPLLDRSFTWSDRPDSPTLVLLERICLNINRDARFSVPNSLP